MEPADEQAPWSRSTVRRPELLQASSARAPKPRRPLTITEFVVLSLGAAVFVASLFSVFAIIRRLGLGHGMGIQSGIAQGTRSATGESLPTLVPTFTPTPAPTGDMVADTTPSILSTTTSEPALPVATVDVRLPASSPPTRLVIPKISVDIPVLSVGPKIIGEGARSKAVWEDVPYAGGFHQTSAFPGNVGNTVINGHRDIHGAVFRHLDKVEEGDEIVVYVGDVAYPYIVTEKVIVPETFASAEQRAENLKYIGFIPEERLTLVTCTPVGLATHRLLVIARPPEQVVPQMPEAGTDSGS
jgi:LPXTG-site transpeptidase (sortase) family protein